MVTSLKCRAKNPAMCSDPNCPERRGAREAFVEQLAVASRGVAGREARRVELRSDIRAMLLEDVDLSGLSSSGEDYVERLRSVLLRLSRSNATDVARRDGLHLMVDHPTRVQRLHGLSKHGREYVDELAATIGKLL